VPNSLRLGIRPECALLARLIESIYAQQPAFIAVPHLPIHPSDFHSYFQIPPSHLKTAVPSSTPYVRRMSTLSPSPPAALY